MNAVNLFRSRNFSLLWFAGLISLTGDWLLSIALPIYVYRLTGSPAATSGVVAANVAAALVVGAVAGVYVDRWDRRRVMVVANVIQACGVLPLMLVHSASQVWIVMVVAAVQASLAQFVAPAEHALLPRLVPADRLAAANSLNALNSNLARLLGPALGGIVAATVGLAGAAALDGVSFAVSAAMIAAISGSHRGAVADSVTDRGSVTAGWRAELVQGLRIIGRSRLLRALFVVVTVTSVGEGIMASLFAVFVDRGLGGGAPEIGWLMSAQAVGGIVGGLASAVLSTRIRPVPMVTAGLIAFGLIDLIIFNYPRWFTAFVPELVFFVLVGLPGALMTAGVMTLLQSRVADGARGRVFAAAMVAESGGRLLGAAVAASLTVSLGVINVLTAQGAGYVLAGLAFSALLRKRNGVRASVPVRGGSTLLLVATRCVERPSPVGQERLMIL